MSTVLNFGRDVSGLNAYAPQFPTDIFTATLATGVNSTVTVPSSCSTWIMYVRVQPDGWVWCCRNGTTSVPASGAFASSTSELIDGTIEFKRTVYAADIIDFITANATCDIEVAFYQVSYA